MSGASFHPLLSVSAFVCYALKNSLKAKSMAALDEPGEGTDSWGQSEEMQSEICGEPRMIRVESTLSSAELLPDLHVYIATSRALECDCLGTESKAS